MSGNPLQGYCGFFSYVAMGRASDANDVAVADAWINGIIHVERVLADELQMHSTEAFVRLKIKYPLVSEGQSPSLQLSL